MTDVSLFDTTELDPSMTEDEWSSIGEMLSNADKDIPWIVGDWILHGVEHYNDGLDQAVKILSHLSQSTVARYKFVASRFSPHHRRNISFWHHSEVAQLPGEVAHLVLDRAIDERLTQKDVRMLAQQATAELKGRMPALDTDKLKAERKQQQQEMFARYYEIVEQVEQVEDEWVTVPKDLFLGLADKIPKPKPL